MQTLLLSDVLPNGAGGFTIIPKRPSQEISSREVARLLKVSRTTLGQILNRPEAQRTIRWRWTSELKGKRVFDIDTIIQYRDACQDSEYGGPGPDRRRK